MKHENNGTCLKCSEIITKYYGFNRQLWDWFISFQRNHPEFHTSCAGRGEQEQEELFLRKATRAHWKQSAHNYGCALDLFVNKKDVDLYDKETFETVLKPEIPNWITWYGMPGSSFYELPHIELKKWRDLIGTPMIKLCGDE